MAIRFLEPGEKPKRRAIKFLDQEQAPTGLEKAVKVSKAITRPFERLGEKLAPAVSVAQSQLGIPEQIGLKALGGIQSTLEKGGEFVTEQLGERGVGPLKSAAIGTAIQMAPDVALAAAPIRGARLLRKAPKIAPKEAVFAAERKLSESARQQLTRRQAFQQLRERSGEQIGAAEEKANIALRSFTKEETTLVNNPLKFKDFADETRVAISGKGIKNLSLAELQRKQKLLGEGLSNERVTGRLIGPDKAGIQETRKKLQAAIAEQKPAIAKAKAKFAKADKLLRELPDVTKKEKFLLKENLLKAKQALETQQSKGIGGFVRSAIRGVLIRSFIPRIR